MITTTDSWSRTSDPKATTGESDPGAAVRPASSGPVGSIKEGV